ncbi:MAG: FAD-dependent oxidoreductase [Oscillospiraceae bacterium]|jgi:2,4-dienoyl-CoA reductase-like NADH-dependent reductase (Old Yellow Enzyme family)/thioredoxin reductase|nr:FAD-dependent oxidoreductase [Oscillospiraceae bacterium]
MYTSPYPNLLKPFKLRGLTVKNRVISAPNMLFHTVAHRPTDYYIRYLEHKARGGAGIVHLGEIAVCDGGNHTPQMYSSDDNLPLFGEMAQVIHEHGALAGVELTHGGFNVKEQHNIDKDKMYGPVAGVNHFGTAVRAMTKADMDYIADKFAETAEFWLRAGFDSIMLHMGHGWIFAQFMSPIINTRSDEYGGSLENRLRFPLQVLKRVRDVIGNRPPLIMRMSGSERDPNGFTVEDMTVFAEQAQEYVDLIEVSSENFAYIFATPYSPLSQNLDLAEHIKSSGRIRIPVYTIGSILSAPQAEEIIASGKADGVSMSRALIADPYLPKKAALGIPNRPCLRCLNCTDSDNRSKHFICSVNPLAGREERLGFGDTPPEKARVAKRVMIIGGGPAGIQAAIAAAERGHSVRLYDRNSALGGWLRFADIDTHKAEVRQFKDWLERELAASGANVVLSTEVTRREIAEYAPDTIIAALGSVPAVPNIKGIEAALHATAAYFAPEKIKGETIAVIGGGLIGVEVGIYLQNRGKKVTVFEISPEICADSGDMLKLGILKSIADSGLTVKTGVKLSEIPSGYDTVLYATGMKPNDSFYFEIANLAPQVILVGDAKKPGRIDGAIHTGYFAATDIQ